MPFQLSGAFVPPRRRRRKAYVPPAMLLNLQVLDLMEITGSQLRAARSLAMHQTTVSRSYWDLAEQFRLQPGRGPRKVCRWGTSTSLRLLRLACRAHRLEDGRLRLATDALHQSLLDGLVGVLQVPPYFHPAADWATLVAQGVIDGAIVSSLCHDQPLQANGLPRWPGVRVVPLGTLELQLVIHCHWAEVWDQQVLLPSERVMPVLHQQLESEVAGLERPTAPGRTRPSGCSNCRPAQWRYRSVRRWHPGDGGRSRAWWRWRSSQGCARGCGCCSLMSWSYPAGPRQPCGCCSGR